MSVENIDIRIKEDGSRVVRRNIEDIGTSASKADMSVKNLNRTLQQIKYAIGAVIGSRILGELKQYIDSWIGIENSIRLSTRTSEEAAAVQDELFKVAQKTRTEMEPLVRLYRRMAQSQSYLGASQREMIDLTEGVGMALVVQGTSINDARGALLQLGQAFGMARVRSQEFNSINENAPRILQAVADNVKGANGNIQELRKMVLAGKISGRDFFNAFLAGMPKLRAEFEKARPTIGQAFAVLDNALGKFIHDSDEGVGASGLFAKGLIGLANNIDTVARAFVGLAAGAMVALGPTIYGLLTRMATGVRALTAAFLANPLTAWLAVIATIVTTLIMFRDQISLSADGLVSLGDYMRAIWDVVKEVMSAIGSFFVQVWNDCVDSARKILGAFGLSFSDVYEGLWDYIRGWANRTIGIFAFVSRTAIALFHGIVPAVNDLFYRAINSVLWLVQEVVNGFLGAYNVFAEVINFFGGEAKKANEVVLQIQNNYKGAADSFSAEIKAAWQEAFNTDWIGKLVDGGARVLSGLTERARKYAELRNKAKGKDANLDIKPPIGPEGEVDTKKFDKSLQRLLDTIDPVGAAIRDVEEGTRILLQAFEMGKIGVAEFTRYMGLLELKYRDAIDPIGALRRELAEETKFMGLEHDARRAGMQLMEIEQRLQTQGIVLDQQARAELLKQLQTNLEVKRVMDEKERIYRKLIAPQRELVQTQEALNRLYQEGKINMASYNQELAEAKVTAGAGNFADGFIVQLNVMSLEAQNFTANTGRVFADFTTSLIDGFAQATAAWIWMGESLQEGIGNAARMALTTLTASLIKLGIQMVLTKTLGDTLALASVATSSAAASAVAAAWAPAAALASLATLGTNSVAANAAIGGSYALAKSIALSSLAGFASGGYTGDLNRNDVAGVVHGKEFVVNADATRRNRATLEAMNKGQTPSDVKMNVQVHNYTGANIKVQRLSPTDIRIIAREEAEGAVRRGTSQVVATELQNPNSRVSKALSNSTMVERRR